MRPWIMSAHNAFRRRAGILLALALPAFLLIHGSSPVDAQFPKGPGGFPPPPGGPKGGPFGGPPPGGIGGPNNPFPPGSPPGGGIGGPNNPFQPGGPPGGGIGGP